MDRLFYSLYKLWPIESVLLRFSLKFPFPLRLSRYSMIGVLLVLWARIVIYLTLSFMLIFYITNSVRSSFTFLIVIVSFRLFSLVSSASCSCYSSCYLLVTLLFVVCCAFVCILLFKWLFPIKCHVWLLIVAFIAALLHSSHSTCTWLLHGITTITKLLQNTKSHQLNIYIDQQSELKKLLRHAAARLLRRGAYYWYRSILLQKIFLNIQ